MSQSPAGRLIWGWVNGSAPEAGFQETVNQSKAMLKAVALAEGFEKLRSRRGEEAQT